MVMGTSSDNPQTIVLGDEEEDDLQRAIRLSLLDAQQQQVSDGGPPPGGNMSVLARRLAAETGYCSRTTCIGPSACLC